MRVLKVTPQDYRSRDLEMIETTNRDAVSHCSIYCSRNGHPLNPAVAKKQELQQREIVFTASLRGKVTSPGQLKRIIPTEFTGCRFSGDLLPHKFSSRSRRNRTLCSRRKRFASCRDIMRRKVSIKTMGNNELQNCPWDPIREMKSFRGQN